MTAIANTLYTASHYKGNLSLRWAERHWILIRLSRHKSIRKAAKSLGVTESCLLKKMNRHHIYKEGRLYKFRLAPE